MSGAPFESSWYRVADLRPRLRGHARIHRHHYRGQLWYVLQDNVSGRYHRFTPAAYQIIGLMDGRRSVRAIWEMVSRRLGEEAPTQDEVVRLLSQLHSADVLQTDVPPDQDEAQVRYRRHRRSRLVQALKAPLALRIPVLDPDRLLRALMPVVRPFLGPVGAVIWLLAVGSALVLAAMHWGELSGNVSERLLSAQNLLILWLTFPVVKALHELGHGFVVRRWGGEVHEMGIMLLVFTPIPYVDASAATAFRSRAQRMLVGAAGMLVELFLAALALFVWLAVEPGLVRTVAYNVMFIAGVSTVLFNGNPLLRFDGYYILADALEIPNLGTRANRYLLYLIERYAFGLSEAVSPVQAPGERGWLVFYALASFAYRLFIYAVIILFVAGKFFVLGLLLAMWAAMSMIVVPLAKAAHYLAASPRLRRRRRRALGLTGAALGTAAALVLALPLPLATVAQGVVWVPQRAHVRAATGGFLDQVVQPSGRQVAAGAELLHLSDPLLPAEARVLEHRLEELAARHRVLSRNDRVEAEIVREEMAGTRAELERARERLDGLRVRSPVAGTLVLPASARRVGRYVGQGELLGYVVDAERARVRVVVPQADVELVRQRTRAVQVRLAQRLGRSIRAELLREVPAASRELPSAALGTQGGGEVVVDTQDSSGRRAFDAVFQFELDMPLPQPLALHVGERAHVRFDHGYEPLAARWYRRLRQLLLSRFDV